MARTRSLRSVSVVAALALSACGGGGGDGGSGGGLDIAPTSLAFAADQNGPSPAVQSIHVTVSDPAAAYVVAGYPQGASVPTWLDLSLSGSGGAWSLQVAVTSTALAPGTHSATLRVAIARSDQSLIAYRDATVSYTVSSALTVSSPSLSFTHVQGGPVPGPQSVTVSGSGGLAWTASASQPWVALGATSGTTPSSVAIGVDPSGLGAGPHSARVTFSAAGRTAAVDVALTVTAQALQTDRSALAFGGVNGAPLAAQSVSVSMNNGAAVAWSATSGAGWLVLGKAGGTTPDSLSVGVDPSVGPLASGTHRSAVTFTASVGGSTLTATVDVELTLTPARFTFAPGTLVLGGADGRDLSPVAVLVGLDTGLNAHAWSATPSATWMSPSPAGGSASATPATIAVTPDSSGLAGGTRTGSIAFAATVNGDAITGSLPVVFNLEAHRLFVPDDGVALTSTPALSRLTYAVRVDDSLGMATPWSASSDRAWLGVTSSGTTGGDLVLTADPTGLAADTLHEATVSVSSSDPTVENVESVRVGLWVGSATPVAVTVSGTFLEVVTDPVRPFAYVHGGGTSVSVYNVQTGASVATIPGFAPALGGMAVSSDGARLFVVDRTNARIVPVRLADLAIETPFDLVATANAYPRLGYMRTNGLPVLVATDGAIHRAADGAVLLTFASPSQVSSSPLVATSRDGNAFCAVGCRSLSWSSLGGGTLSMATLQGSGGSHDTALAHDGSRVHGASGAPYHCTDTDTATGASAAIGPSRPYPGNVEVGPDGRIYCGRYSTLSGEQDVYVFDAARVELGSLRVAAPSTSLLNRQLVLSGDGLRAVGLTGAPALRIVTVP